ncbi:hypothetical protein RHSIM_Rhsim02G0080900 [Rhododendron simsii]|uniref:Uncharacterized protein n=1 Tax=Rhododendron simsii TaxID=118357 RepID=A0A834LTN8_RHOSS|nr:hypothetical protein RHSIM_Rhsim02G0080900 [Rhododendron simsii]
MSVHKCFWLLVLNPTPMLLFCSQRRVFVVQVFVLHRLIKVQKLIAASPELLLQSELHLGKSSIEGLPTKKLPSGNLLEAPPQLLSKLKPQTPIHDKECAAENVWEMPLLPYLSNQSDIKLNTRKKGCKLGKEVSIE